ncbi:hypothetical protein LTR27_004891 [Elasticomyces elasticus]|nr:hypothetical protein LTR27_004891 [Elasticomyces elasticus]
MTLTASSTTPPLAHRHRHLKVKFIPAPCSTAQRRQYIMVPLEGSSSKDIFDFLSLARELRDLIYVELCCKEVSIGDTEEQNLRLKATGLAHTNILQINRQIRTEYQAVSTKVARLDIMDHLLAASQEIELSVPVKLRDSPELGLYVVAACEDDRGLATCLIGELDSHFKRAAYVTKQLPRLRKTCIELHIQQCRHAGQDLLQKTIDFCLAQITAVPTLKQLVIFNSQWIGESWDYSKHGKCLATWTPTAGFKCEKAGLEFAPEQDESEGEDDDDD